MYVCIGIWMWILMVFLVELLSESDIFLMLAFKAFFSEHTDGFIQDRVIQIPPVK